MSNAFTLHQHAVLQSPGYFPWIMPSCFLSFEAMIIPFRKPSLNGPVSDLMIIRYRGWLFRIHELYATDAVDANND